MVPAVKNRPLAVLGGFGGGALAASRFAEWDHAPFGLLQWDRAELAVDSWLRARVVQAIVIVRIDGDELAGAQGKLFAILHASQMELPLPDQEGVLLFRMAVHLVRLPRLIAIQNYS